MKKLLLLMGLCFTPLITAADEVATNLMILNNSNSQQFNDIWSRMRADFKLAHPQTDRVKYFERLYTKNPKNFNRLMANALPYLYFILNEIERNGLPAELALIPGIESSYDPLAKNPGDAYAGMWQFVPSTGRRFNMIQNSSIDERRDIVKSTRSALGYFNYLHLMFGQWDVAIGAYNWGEGGMYRAILNSGMPLGKVTYSDLQLRQITADYLPKIIALATIVDNPGKFGVTLEKVPNQPYFAMVTPALNTRVSDVSRLSSTDTQIFTKLNAEYKDHSYSLAANNNILLPQANQGIYYANIGQAVVIANGVQLAGNSQQQAVDTNIKPAALVLVSPPESAALDDQDTVSAADDSDNSTQNNHELDDLLAKIDPNTQQVAAQSQNAGATTAIAASTSNSMVKYKVNSGDTLYSIARKFNANINQIRNDNHIPGNNLLLGQTLYIKTASQ